MEKKLTEIEILREHKRIIEFLIGTKDNPKQVGLTKNTLGEWKSYVWLEDVYEALNKYFKEDTKQTKM